MPHREQVLKVWDQKEVVNNKYNMILMEFRSQKVTTQWILTH